MDFDLDAAGFSGVLLAGGTAARMDGIDKASIELHGRSLLEIGLDSFLDADEVVVVGPRTVPTTRPVTFTCEDPPLGGPVAGLLTGFDMLLRPATLVGVLAVDMPRVSPHTFRRLREATTGHDGAFLVDPSGRRQLCGVVTAEALRRVRPDLEGQHGMALHRLLADLDLAEVAAVSDEGRDIDTWADLRDLDD
ncbi:MULTISPECIES: molybdenum cofactor guanylyltransferase [Nocardioides]|uniref:molybdenum cofactor guanylyltransferase n=1 Tax=Nocardioides TaxID=1839 RepID=UPI000330C2B3|nr:MULTISPECIES: NTP transferase domain-containing protein [Nocardioides]EON25660.1 molybdopterin-guanine dinucleotide biosynthesis [Nocardioides sp. CF8]